ncbi:CHRD domain protein [compost metagenome]
MKNPALLLVKSIGCFLLLGILITSCQKDTELLGKEKTSPTAEKIKAYDDIQLCTTFEVPAHMDRHETGTACIHLFDDMTLYFELEVNNLKSDDQLTVAHIHDAGPLNAGPVIVGLVDGSSIAFNNNKAKGTISLTADQYNRILDGNNLYVNIHSTQLPSGLVRNQLDHPLKFGADVDLSPDNQVPPIVSGASGHAMVRISTDKILFSHITVENLDAGDALVIAHIHNGAPGVNGPVIINLADDASQFGLNQERAISDSQFDLLFSNPLYVNAHSTMFPAGVVRGPLKD